MHQLKQEPLSLISFYRDRQAELTHLADDLGIPTLGREVRNELANIVGRDNVELLETVARIGAYGDTKEMQRARKALATELKKAGYPQRPGKRTAPGLQEMVEDLTPVLLYFGVPLSLSESAPLVTALRYIGEGLGVPGDPRNELRKLQRLQKAMQAERMESLREAVKKGLAHLKI